MPELRKDPVGGHWVIITREKAKRPAELARAPEARRGGFCPFDCGHEDKTPPEILAYRPPGAAPNSGGWRLRVVPNKFPVLQIEADPDPHGCGPYDVLGGLGAHEVIIETPEHDLQLKDFPPEQLALVLRAIRERLTDLRRDVRLKYVLAFKNFGREAGALLEHPHAQLIALPVTPLRVEVELNSGAQFYQYKNRCLFCDIIRHELAERARLVEANAEFVVLEPFAPRNPFETWILPRRHRAQFDTIGDAELESLAGCFHRLFNRLHALLGPFPYNYILHCAPLQAGELPYYHWHFEIIPHLHRRAGFEWGSGFFINPTPPEEAAAYLRGEGGTE